MQLQSLSNICFVIFFKKKSLYLLRCSKCSYMCLGWRGSLVGMSLLLIILAVLAAIIILHTNKDNSHHNKKTWKVGCLI